MKAGHDYVGTIRTARQRRRWRKTASRAMNRLRERITHITMTDQGCMLRAYDRRIVDTINRCREINTFIPALAYTFANNPVEIEVGARGARGGRVEVLAVLADPPQLRPRHRLLARAAAGVLAVRRRAVDRLGGAGPRAGDPAHLLRAGSRRPVHAVRHRVLPDRRDAARHRPARRIRRSHLRAGPRPSALDRARRPRASGRRSGRA